MGDRTALWLIRFVLAEPLVPLHARGRSGWPKGSRFEAVGDRIVEVPHGRR